MIKVKQCLCPWCHRTVHAILSYGEWVGECSVCADGFVVPVGATECNQDQRKVVDEFFDSLSFDDLKAKLRESGYTEELQ